MKRGFTLVELSIVLVIIGLLIGGILAAQSMISTVKVQKIIRDLQQYDVAVTNFQTNYKSFPGDSMFFMPPGNGDGKLGNVSGFGGCHPVNTQYANTEKDFVFAHLSQSGMLSTKYLAFSPTYCGGTQTQSNIIGVIAPALDQDANYAAALGVSKTNLGFTNYISNYNAMYFTTSPANVITLMQKIGAGDLSTSSAGVHVYSVNAPCYYLDSFGDYSHSTCTSPDAIYGGVYYFMDTL